MDDESQRLFDRFVGPAILVIIVLGALLAMATLPQPAPRQSLLRLLRRPQPLSRKPWPTYASQTADETLGALRERDGLHCVTPLNSSRLLRMTVRKRHLYESRK
jgi:hypothetical protein